MNIDLRTLVIVLGITDVLQAVAIFLQYLMNKTYRGIGGWALGFSSVAMGFILLLFRDFISIDLISIILANTLLILGEIFIYIGSMRFLDKKENRGIVVSIFIVFFLFYLYFTYVNNNINDRTAVQSATVAIISLLTAHGLFVNKTHSTTTSANFLSAVFLAHGCFFAFRSVETLMGPSIGSVFSPTLMQTATFLVQIVFGILWTLGFIIMVNQRLNAEMKEAKEHFELLFTTSPDATLITRLTDGLIVNINEGFTALTGFTRDDTIGKSSMDVNIWHNPADRQKVVTELREKGFLENMEAVFLRKDGSQPIGIMSARIITLQSAPHIISVTRDITDRKRAEEAIRALNEELKARLQELTEARVLEAEANRAKTEFLTNISHEFTTPLNHIIGFSQVLLGKNFGDLNEKQRGYAENILNSGERLHETLKNIVSFVRIDVSNPDMDWEDLRLKDIVDSTLSVFLKPATDRHLTITLDMEKEADRMIRVDRGKIAQVFHNLLSNAVKFSREGGQITLSVRNRKGWEESGKDNFMEITIEDRGIGIREEELPRLFRPFEQLDASLTKQFAGVGMGLLLARKLIEAHGGAIRVESDYGKGSRFIFTIPVKDGQKNEQ